MKGDLYINGKDAFTEWGVCMGKGFINAIRSASPMKDFIENESRLEHGKRIIVDNPKVKGREVTLSFTIIGRSKEDYRIKKDAFIKELENVNVTLRVSNYPETYKLIYTGKSIVYGESIAHTNGMFSAKFEEPNPKDR